MRATATFEITRWDDTTWEEGDGCAMARVDVAKAFTGAIEGTSVAQVLTCGTPDGPAAYTAQERFTGTVDGRSGTFISQHGAASLDGLTWVVVTGSGTGELAGITGTGGLEMVDGVHHFTLDYELPPA